MEEQRVTYGWVRYDDEVDSKVSYMYHLQKIESEVEEILPI